MVLTAARARKAAFDAAYNATPPLQAPPAPRETANVVPTEPTPTLSSPPPAPRPHSTSTKAADTVASDADFPDPTSAPTPTEAKASQDEANATWPDDPLSPDPSLAAALATLPNARDVACVLPQRLRPGRLFRAAAPNDSDEALHALLHVLRVRTFVDLRDTGEEGVAQTWRLWRVQRVATPELTAELRGTTPEQAATQLPARAESLLQGAVRVADAVVAAAQCQVQPAEMDESEEDGASGASTTFPIKFYVSYHDLRTMRSALLKSVGLKNTLYVATSYILGKVFSSWQTEARDFMMRRFNEGGLLGLYILLLEHFGEGINLTLRVVATRFFHPVMIHCTHGKDSTGLTMALIQRLLGVSDTTIVQDYHRSESYGKSAIGRLEFNRKPCMDVEHWCLSPPAIMVGALAYLDARWGGIKEYCDSIGFDAAWQAQLIRALTE